MELKEIEYSKNCKIFFFENFERSSFYNELKKVLKTLPTDNNKNKLYDIVKPWSIVQNLATQNSTASNFLEALGKKEIPIICDTKSTFSWHTHKLYD